MAVTTGAGAEVEVAAEVDIRAGVGDGDPAAAREREAAAARRAVINAIARTIKVAAAVTLDGSGNGTATFQGPFTGYRWTVRRISVLSAAGLTVSMGSGIAGVYAGTKGGPGLIVPANLEWIISPLPNAATFSSEHLPLSYGEDLSVVISGGTPAQSVIVSLAYQLYGAARVGNPS
jgi:hypothetical protein